MLRKRSDHRKAQSFLEYTIVVSTVVLILFAMNTMIKRGTQGMIKVVADQIGLQENGDQRFDASGYLENSYTSVRTSIDKLTTETPGIIGYVFDDEVIIDSKAYMNLGFTNQN